MIERLVEAATRIGAAQEPDGGLRADADGEAARAALPALAEEAARIAEAFGADAYAEALVADTRDWLARDARGRPDFSRSRDALRAPEDERPFFFFGPLRLANGGRVGYRFECFLALREEPDDAPYRALYAGFPHPKNICQSAHLIAGSPGLTRGNNIVFFPENIAAPDVPDKQLYALFFFNKFKAIYETITIPSWDRVGRRDALVASRGAHARDVYEARCVWGYLHDYFHHRGPRSFDEHIGVKTRWFTGLLEELKVDLQSFRVCRAGGVPHGAMVAEFILFDRTMRYPGEPDWSRNFDSGTGLLLLAYLAEAGAIGLSSTGRLDVDLIAVEAAGARFVAEVEALERLRDADYLQAAEAMVRRYLPAPGPGEIRFGVPEILRGSLFHDLVGRAPTIAFRLDEGALGERLRPQARRLAA